MKPKVFPIGDEKMPTLSTLLLMRGILKGINVKRKFISNRYLLL
jgi:hypothetical protein